ncbi:N-acetylmuramate alpha-1-phosphate uridylyltransferase MurU [uncultured Salinisphaera sp.]|uniref:N-acetylmuramate alpha-1-phosphate uridylyltransferase MurU n=1 Tax=uncultured Salinisphaera sp. TaxID=359372 RepID=UPI0032B1246D
MKAMILAAGRGERLRPLTDETPKPLIEVGTRSLIGHHLHALAAGGFEDVVINVAYRGEQIVAALGDGSAWGLRLHYSRETPGELDTGGGIKRALPLLGEAPFALISADVFTDYDYARLHERRDADAHCVLVENPEHHAQGDFGLVDGRLVDREPRLTYAGIGVFDPQRFASRDTQRFALSVVIREALGQGRASGEQHRGEWIDVGRPSALEAARHAAVRG